jgi:hypothetical protein
MAGAHRHIPTGEGDTRAYMLYVGNLCIKEMVAAEKERVVFKVLECNILGCRHSMSTKNRGHRVRKR